MATKTLILRPIKVTSEKESLITLYPNDTNFTNAHMLVNEEIADDDATYIALTGAGGMIYYHFVYNKPEDLKSIINITINVREKLESGTNKGSASLYIGSSMELGNVENSANINTIEYTDRILPSVSKDAWIELFNNADANTEIRFKRTINSNTSKASPLRATQVYIEVTYETNELDPLYLKKNNQWFPVEYKLVYQKINNSWNVSESFLEVPQKYIIKEV